MPTSEELKEQRGAIIQRNNELHIYLMESRRIQGDINEITYKCNSGMYASYELQRKERLEKELREKNAELRRTHRLSPQRVERKIREYDSAISKIDEQLNAQEASGHDSRIRPTGGQPLSKYDGLYETPKGQHIRQLHQERSRDDERDR